MKSILKLLRYILVATVSITLLSSCTTSGPKTGEVKTEEPESIILGVNAYSFADLLQAENSRDGQKVYTLFNLLDWCSANNIRALDPTAYFFPTYPEVPSDVYLEKFKNYADSLGIAISGTGVRNNFASPDPEVRAEGVELAKNWIVAASKLGAPVVRVFAGAIPEGYEDKWEEPAQWMIDCYKELLPFAEKYGVKIGIQNHADMLQTAEQCLFVLDALDSKWAGLIVDTGNLYTGDPYAEIAALVPYAINWQVKESPRGIGGEEKTDYARLIRIIEEGGYTGYVPVETLLVNGVPYDPFKQVTGMLEELGQALKRLESEK